MNYCSPWKCIQFEPQWLLAITWRSARRRRPGSSLWATPHTGPCGLQPHRRILQITKQVACDTTHRHHKTATKFTVATFIGFMFWLCRVRRQKRDRSGLLAVLMWQSLKHILNSEVLQTAKGTKVLTYGLDINSIVSCARAPAVTVQVEALKVLRLFRMGRDPVWVRVHCDELEQSIRFSWPKPFLQKPSLLCRVLFVKFNQVPTFGDQSGFQSLHRVLDHFHLQMAHNRDTKVIEGLEENPGSSPILWKT